MPRGAMRGGLDGYLPVAAHTGPNIPKTAGLFRLIVVSLAVENSHAELSQTSRCRDLGPSQHNIYPSLQQESMKKSLTQNTISNHALSTR